MDELRGSETVQEGSQRSLHQRRQARERGEAGGRRLGRGAWNAGSSGPNREANL